MRRAMLIGLTAVAILVATAGAASAHSNDVLVHEPWVPAPSRPFDRAAGDACDFPIHADIVTDEVRTKVVARHQDGSISRQLATGTLLIRVTNTDNGASTLTDASGSALFVFDPDGTVRWFVVGPVIAAFKEGASNIPRGLWIISGVYTITFQTDGFKEVTGVHMTLHDVCADID